MPTEEQLRSTMTALADQPYATDHLFAAVMKRTARRPARRRRTAVVLALAAVAVIAALVLPQFLVQRTVVPADQRVRGNWNLIHTVDLPPNWEVVRQTIGATSETTGIRTPTGAGDDFTSSCTIIVFGRNVFHPAPAGGRAVTVNGTTGYAQVGTAKNDFVGGVFWPYAEQAWATVDCVPAGDQSKPTPAAARQSLEIAQRVRFVVTTVRLPFRLKTMPEGHQIQDVDPMLPANPNFLGGVQFSSADKSRPAPYLDIVMSTGRTEVPEHIPGWETDTVKGVPAVLSARDGKLCLNLTERTLCITSEGGEPADLTKSLWAAGRREMLMGIAQDLTVGPHLDDPSRWFPANQALPG